MYLGDHEIRSNISSGNVESVRGGHGNGSGIEGSDSSSLPETLHFVISGECLNAAPSETQEVNIAIVPPPLRSYESEDSSDSPSSNNGRTVLCSSLNSLCPPLENIVYRSSYLTKDKSPAEHFWRQCFGCLSAPKDDNIEESSNADLDSSPVSDGNTAEKNQKNRNALVDISHSVTHSYKIVPDIALDNSNCISPGKLNERKRSDDSRENVFNEVNKIFVPNRSEFSVPAKIMHNVGPVSSTRVSPLNSCSAPLALSKSVQRSCEDSSEGPLFVKEDWASSDRSCPNMKKSTLLESGKGCSNLKSVVDCMNINQSENKSFPKDRILSISSVTNLNTNCISEASDLKDLNHVELQFLFGNKSLSKESNRIADGAEDENLFCLPNKSSDAQNEEDNHSASIKNLMNSDLSFSNKIARRRSPSLAESFSEPSQHFNMSAVHKDIKLMRLKSDELPSFPSPSSPTFFRLNTASTTTSTPLRGCRSILAVSRLKNTPSPPVNHFRSQRALETSLEYPLEKLVKKDKANEMQEQDSSLCANMSFANTDRSNMYSPVPCSFSNLTSQSESDDSGGFGDFVLKGSVIRKINFSEENLVEIERQKNNSAPWLQTLLSRTLDSTELKICTLACQMAWELQEKVYSEIYERLSHMETVDEHYRIEETSRYKFIYLDKIERLWHFIVPLLEPKYWNRRSLKVVNKNLLIYGNRRLNAKQWEFANYNNCVFDVKCVFDYGLYAFDTSNPVFHRDNIQNFLVPNYNPEVSSEEAYK